MNFLNKTMLPCSVLNIVFCVYSFYFISKDLAFLNFATACVCYLSWRVSKV